MKLKENRVYIIAELSANHNHNFDLAVKTIEAMAASGADAVKVQTYKPDSLVMDINNEHFGMIKSGLWKGVTGKSLCQSNRYSFQSNSSAYLDMGMLR